MKMALNFTELLSTILEGVNLLKFKFTLIDFRGPGDQCSSRDPALFKCSRFAFFVLGVGNCRIVCNLLLSVRSCKVSEGCHNCQQACFN